MSTEACVSHRFGPANGICAWWNILGFHASCGYNVAQGDQATTENSVVRARINEATKNEAAAVLAAMGLSLSDAFRLLLTRVAAEKALPFDPLVPNAETIAAMKAARRGVLVTAGPPGALLASLNADD